MEAVVVFGLKLIAAVLIGNGEQLRFGFGLVIVSVLAPTVSIGWVASVLTSLSLFTRYNDFSLGVINLADIIFFLSLCAVFVFLTVRVFEKKRWG